MWLRRNGGRCQPERRALCQLAAVILPASISASCLGLSYRHIVAYYPCRNTCRRDLHCNFNHKVLQIIDAARPRSPACSAACSAACSPPCSPVRREAGQDLASLTCQGQHSFSICSFTDCLQSWSRHLSDLSVEPNVALRHNLTKH